MVENGARARDRSAATKLSIAKENVLSNRELASEFNFLTIAERRVSDFDF